jgi:hypothetical protein
MVVHIPTAAVSQSWAGLLILQKGSQAQRA